MFEINRINANAINSYKAIKSTKPADVTCESGKKSASGNFDKVEFDFSQALASAKVNVVSVVTGDADSARIDALKAQYANGFCPRSALQIAAAVLGE